MCALAIVAIALLLRLVIASGARNPGHADPAYYTTVAENLVDGRGFVIDYIWHFLARPNALTHYSNDYWMPLPSVFIASSFILFGRSTFAAVLPSVLFVLALFPLTYRVGRAYARSRFVALSAASLVLFLPALFEHSLVSDSTAYYVVFAVASLLCMILAAENVRFLLLASLFAALAHLTRQDGILLLVTLVIAVVASPKLPRDRHRILWLVLVFAVYVATLSPLLVSNYRAFGSPLPAGPGKTPFLTAYEDLYSYSKELSLGAYLDWGTTQIVASKLDRAARCATEVFNLLGGFAWAFVVLAGLDLARFGVQRRFRYAYIPPFLFLLTLLGFYVIIGTAVAEWAFWRTIPAMAPFLLVAVASGIERSTPNRKTAIALVGLLVLLFACQGVQSARARIQRDNRIASELVRVRDVLDELAAAMPEQELVVMTRDPWEVYHWTRRRSVQIPNDDLDTILEVADRCGATHLLLPAPREALNTIYAEERQDARLQLVVSVPAPTMKQSDLKLFRFVRPPHPANAIVGRPVR
ncbi:MAG: glycosyltransferase family 39 protein [Candidatus Latescibacterota bacterium]|nr:MAG: glycosyltransferase family 39 protein [Candidatus Latescibacterota bacterium]